MKVLITGATGNLGRAVSKRLVERGFDVRGTDQRYKAGLPIRIELADVLDELSVYRLCEGMDAVVHLANYPNVHACPSGARLLSENVTMNSNVFAAAGDLGLKHVVFASSIQVMLAFTGPGSKKPPFTLPYLPLDGDCPADTGSNPYALSKHFGEQMLRLLATAKPDLACTSLRFPLLVGEWYRRRFSSPDGISKIPRQWLDLAEATAHLTLEDASECIADVLERGRPGYHQYFPAQTMELSGFDVPRLVREFFGGVPLRRPLDSIESLIDLSAIREAVGWSPKERIRAEIVDD